MRLRSIAIASMLAWAGTVLAQDAGKDGAKEPAKDVPKKALPRDLLVGDKAPALAIEKWVKGDPVAKFENGKVYVVEFWATWCGPCVQAQPHLTELQKKYKDKGVTFIGVTSADENNPLDKVEEMVKKRDDKMGYTVAWDKGRTTNEAFMEGAAQMGIPTAFLVDQEGTLAWVGHPMKLEDPIEQVLAKKWDIKKAAEKFKTEFDDNKEEVKFQEAVEASHDLVEKFQEAMSKEDYPAAMKVVDELIEKKPVLASRLSMAKIHILLQTKDYDKAYALAEQSADKYFAKKAGALTQLARMILEDEGNSKKNADLALKFVKRAAELDPESDEVLDTLAMAYAEKGDFAKAIEVQKKLIAQAEKDKQPEEALSELKGRLKEYETKAKGGKKDGDK